MTSNMQIWNAVKHPPEESLKTIRGGRLSGMTDIKPQWRYQAMTEQFGPCGIGWKYTIDKQWTEPVCHDQLLCFTNVSLFIRDGEQWSDAIPGTGGSTLIAKEAAGLHASDEGYKMATTDALSVALKMLGVGSDIYMGHSDGSKYKESTKADYSGDILAAFAAAKDKKELKAVWDKMSKEQHRKYCKDKDLRLGEL